MENLAPLDHQRGSPFPAPFLGTLLCAKDAKKKHKRLGGWISMCSRCVLMTAERKGFQAVEGQIEVKRLRLWHLSLFHLRRGVEINFPKWHCSYSVLTSLPYTSCSHLRDSSFILEPDLSFMDTTFSDVIYFINIKPIDSQWDVRQFRVSYFSHDVVISQASVLTHHCYLFVGVWTILKKFKKAKKFYQKKDRIRTYFHVDEDNNHLSSQEISSTLIQ